MAENPRLQYHQEHLVKLKQQLAERENLFPGDEQPALLEQINATERLILKYSEDRPRKLYCVQGTVVINTNDRDCVSVSYVKQIPTFFLDADIQGIRDQAHAMQIAREIVDPYDLQYESRTFNLTVEPI